MLSATELARLADGASLSKAKPGLTGGMPNCQWTTDDGRFIQTITLASPDWAQSLPDTLRALEASGLFGDTQNMEKLRAGAELVEAGQQLDPTRACSLFSRMVELQGRPAGSQWTVTIVPTEEDPRAVAGQMCSGGRFSSVLVAAQAGLEEPLPLDQVLQALKAVHRRTLA